MLTFWKRGASTVCHSFGFFTTCRITPFTAVVQGCMLVTSSAPTGAWRKSWTTAEAVGVCSTVVVAIGGN